MTSIETTIAFVRSAWRAANIDGSRSKIDIYVDRLTRAASESTLARAMESFMQSINASAAKLDPDVVARMVAVASGPDAPRVLRWLREQPKLVSMLAYTKDDELLADALRDLELPPAAGAGSGVPRRPYKIELTATCETPLAHGAEESGQRYALPSHRSADGYGQYDRATLLCGQRVARADARLAGRSLPGDDWSASRSVAAGCVAVVVLCALLWWRAGGQERRNGGLAQGYRRQWRCARTEFVGFVR